MTGFTASAHLGRCGMAVLAAILCLGPASSRTDPRTEELIGSVQQVVVKTGTMTTTRMFDPQGRLLESVTLVAPPPDQPEEDARVQRREYAYGEDGRRRRELTSEGGGEPYLSRLYAYDEGERVAAEAGYHMCGTFSFLQLQIFDRAERLREQVSYPFRAVVRTVYEYDQQGQRTKQEDYKNGVLRSTVRFEYDDQGRLRDRLTLAADGVKTSRTRYQYDDRGNPITEEVTDFTDPSRSSTATFTYTYDAHGNWTHRTLRQHHSLSASDASTSAPVIEETERLITYF